MWPFSNIKKRIIKIAITDWLKEEKMFNFLAGKRTYITMALIIIFGALDAYNGHCLTTELCKSFAVPAWIFSILGALGIYTRSIAKPK